jgi:DNA-directed RNA polymerase specialized sigma24 family protein
MNGEGPGELTPELEERLANVRRRAYRAATRRGLSGDEADDIAEEITESVRKRLALTPRFLQDEKALVMYVATAVKNRCADRARAEKAAKNREFAVGHWLYSRRSLVFDPLHWLGDPADRVGWYLEELPAQIREIIVRLYFCEESQTKIAWDLGITPQSVHTQKMRGLAKLRAAYLKQEFGPPAQWHKLHPRGKPKRPNDGNR